MTIAEPTDRSARRRILAVLLLVCALGLSLRIYHAVAAVAISPDSALFIAYAQELADDPVGTLRRYQQHPLYPGLILLFHGPAGWFMGEGSAGWILAGRLAAIAGGVGAILALYWFAARLYDRRCGLLAGAMLAVLPDACRFGADVLSDLPHLAFYLVGLAALLTGMQTERGRFLLVVAAASALAFLTRPEGASVLLVALVVLALHHRWPLKRRAGLAVAMVAVFLCLAGPYQLTTGKLVPKKSPLELFKSDGAARGDAPETHSGCYRQLAASANRTLIVDTHERTARPKRSAIQGTLATTLPVPINVLRQWVRAGRVVYALLAIVGVIVARPRGVGGRILAAAIGVHLLLVHALEYQWGYLDRRHALILATLSLPLAAAGVWWLASRFRARSGATRSNAPWRVAVGTLVVCALLTSPWLLRPINPGEEHVVASARWLSRHTAPGTPIYTDDRLRRVALYAERPFVRWPWWQGGVGHLARFLKDRPAGCLVVDARHITSPERNPAFFEQIQSQLGDRLKLLHAESAPWQAQPTEIRIYDYQPGENPDASR